MAVKARAALASLRKLETAAVRANVGKLAASVRRAEKEVRDVVNLPVKAGKALKAAKVASAAADNAFTKCGTQ